MRLIDLKADIKKESNKSRAKFLQRFFKTGRGEYSENDIFLGLRVPESRIIANRYPTLSFSEIKNLLHSKYHEERLIALLILIAKFRKEPEKVYKFYLANIKFVNNWDLVDLSADKVVGVFLFGGDAKILNKLAKSENIWERRIAMVATYHFIRNNNFGKTIEIAKALLKDKHDLIHKAVGWMLREVGKRDEKVLIRFLDSNVRFMPRTTLRYAIERFPESKRKYYLQH